MGERAKDLIQEVIAISPPVNLESSARLLGNPKNWVYERYLTDLLVEDVNFRHQYFPDLPPIELPRGIGIMDFDEMYLAPHCGFASAKEYYQASSSIYLIHNICVPCNVLFAVDDPIIEADGLDDVSIPDGMNVYKCPGGGHMGFLSRPNKKTGVRWMDGVLLSWIFKD